MGAFSSLVGLQRDRVQTVILGRLKDQLSSVQRKSGVEIRLKFLGKHFS